VQKVGAKTLAKKETIWQNVVRCKKTEIDRYPLKRTRMNFKPSKMGLIPIYRCHLFNAPWGILEDFLRLLKDTLA